MVGMEGGEMGEGWGWKDGEMGMGGKLGMER